MLIKSEFQRNFKNAKVTPVHKNNSQNDEIHRPVSILLNRSKV